MRLSLLPSRVLPAALRPPRPAGANLPCDAAAVRFFEQQGVTFGPGKAANGGGVAVSGLELAQDRLGLYWSREEVGAAPKGSSCGGSGCAASFTCRPPSAASCAWCPPLPLQVCEKLRSIMRQIYRSCRDAADEYNVSLAAGARGRGRGLAWQSVPASGEATCCSPPPSLLSPCTLSLTLSLSLLSQALTLPASLR